MTTILETRPGTGFTGPVHRPGDPGYDARRAAFRPTVDSRPELIVEAADETDVALAVRTARERGLDLAVQGTGHGTLVPSRGLLLRTGLLDAVTIDPHRGTARVGAGTRWGAVVAAAAPYGLAPVSGTSFDVGVAGYTFGGGLSWRSRRCGYAADSLVRVRAATADGDVVVASRDEHPDLFWAFRGGGGGYAVATELEFRLYPTGGLFGGRAYYPIERAAAVLAFYAGWAPSQPDELTTTVALGRGPSELGPGRRVVIVRAVGRGPDAERALGELCRVAGPALGGGFGAITYDDIPGIGDTRPMRFERVRDVPDGLVDLMITAAGPDAHPEAAAELRFWGGALATPPGDGGAIGHRDVPFSVILSGPPAHDADLSGHATGGAFLNFLYDTTRTHTAFSAAGHARLRRVKRAYDPENVFATGHTVTPAERP
ncbi:MAG: FAD-binding protein [Streptosporangiales bacterium]|nr:FAD-binding protein [Streptosporangiales bacterium]